MDYAAEFRDGTLTVTAEGGDPETLRMLLKERFPQVEMAVRRGVIPPSAQKRMVSMGKMK